MAVNQAFEATMNVGDGGVNTSFLAEERRKKQASAANPYPAQGAAAAAQSYHTGNEGPNDTPGYTPNPARDDARRAAAGGAPAPRPTFAQMQAQGVARPAPPAPAPAPMAAGTYPAYAPPAQTAYAGNPAIQASIAKLLGQPSYYTNEQFNADVDRKGQGIDDDYALQEKQLREEMVARGLSESSIQGGRLSDLNIGRRQAKTDLVAQMAADRAKQMDEAQFRALTAGMDYEKLGLEGQRVGFEGQRVGLEADRNRLDAEFNRAKLALDERVSMGQLSQGEAKLELDRLSEENDRKYKEAALTFDKDKYSSEKEYRAGRDTYEEGRDAISDERYAADDQWKKETWQADYDAMLAKLLGTDVVKYGSK